MRESVVNEVSTIGKGIYQEQNLPLPRWVPELSTMIASAIAKAAAKAVANAIPSIQDSEERPIAYAAKALTKSQKKWAPTKIEMYALVFAQAMQRLQGLLKMFTRKPKMKAEYLEFMGKVIEKGHALSVPRDDDQPPPGRSWYLLHFVTYHNTKHTIRVVFDSSNKCSYLSLTR
ncbi:hypothetical protein ACROYT_G013666 [Oculina patagonica]